MRRLAPLPSIGLLLVATTVALAASPVKGGVYTGTKKGVVDKKIVLVVAPDGQSAIARLYCSGARASVMHGIGIAKGRFSGRAMSGSSVVWALKGRFDSHAEAVATARLRAVCDGGHTTLTLTRATS